MTALDAVIEAAARPLGCDHVSRRRLVALEATLDAGMDNIRAIDSSSATC